MNISLQSHENDVVDFEIEGRVSQQQLAKLSDPLVELAGDGVYGRKILMDLSRIPMLDSSGVGWFLTRHKLCKEAGGQLVLHSLSTMTQNVFKVLNMHMVIKIANSRKEAAKIVNSA